MVRLSSRLHVYVARGHAGTGLTVSMLAELGEEVGEVADAEALAAFGSLGFTAARFDHHAWK